MTHVVTVEQFAVSDLVPSNHNARTHDRRQIRQIAASIREFGFRSPVLVDEDNVLIAGHGRLEAAKLLGLKTVPGIRITDLSAARKRALMIADNRIALNAGWNTALLASELADLSALELDFDMTVTGFETAEIDILLGDATSTDVETPESAPEPDPDRPVITRRGDLWRLGDHLVLCGDARSAADYQQLMGDCLADAIFADAPYNVPVNGHVSGKGRVRHREFAEASGEMSSEEFRGFLGDAFGLAARHSREGSVAFVCMDWRHFPEAHAAGMTAWDAWLNLCVWAKTNGGMGSLYRSQHELVLVFRKGQASHRNNVQLGRFGRNRTNVWSYAGVNTFREGRLEELRAHPTAKPVAMVRDALLDVTTRGELVLDPFLGAGATLIAAERCGRRCAGLEIDPAYVDVILRRWRAETGEDPVRVNDGRPLASLEDELSGEAPA
jgi:DNA modification methylase